jgi:hypothetical protein
MYLFGGRVRRIAAPFGRGEMRRFIVCYLFAAKTAEITDVTCAAAGTRFGGRGDAQPPWCRR